MMINELARRFPTLAFQPATETVMTHRIPSTRFRNTPLFRAISTLPLLLALGACNRPLPAEELMADARRFSAQGDAKAAIIQLKNVVQQEPNHAPARLMLGQMYLITGDMASAEKELRRARELGAKADLVQPALGKALLSQGQFQRVLEEFPEGQGGAEALALRGQALLGLARPDEARTMFERALQVKSGFADATLGLAKLALIGENADMAMQLVDQAIVQNPNSVDSLRLKGDLQLAGKDAAAARKTYERILEVEPTNVLAHLDLANLAIQEDRLDDARQQIKLARKAQPKNLLISYSQALLDFREKRYKSALEQVQQVLRVAPEHMPSVLLAGAVSVLMGSDTRAEQYLNQFLEANPKHPYASKLLATVALRSGKRDDALGIMRTALKDTPNDADLLALAGEAELQAQNFKQSAAYFEKASALKPERSDYRLGHGLSRLRMGEGAKAIPELERAAGAGDGSERAGTLLVMGLMRDKQFDKALKAVDTMIAKGDSAMLQNLRGGVLLGSGDIDAARAGFVKALALDPAYLPSLDNLANLDMLAKKPDDARKRYETALARDKKNVALLTSLAKLEARIGKPADAARWLERATSENPNDKASAQQLASFYLQTGEKQKALTLARKLQATDTADPGALMLLAQALELNQQNDAALENWERLAALQPKSAAVQLRIAGIHLERKRYDEALLAVRKAVRGDPDSTEAVLLQHALLVDKRAFSEALAAAQSLQMRHADWPLGFKLEGDVLMAQQKPGDAVQRYQRALEVAPSGAIVIALHGALVSAGKQQEAVAQVRQWLDKQPGDVQTRTYYASTLMRAGDHHAANQQYEQILRSAPDNPAILNDYAWSLLQLKDARALGHAEKAHKLAPKSPAIADTLAAILLEKGDAARAVPLLKTATEQAPAENDIRLRFAQALLMSGDRKGARAQCERLLSVRDFKRHAEVRALMAKL
jgi:putative PEP-CTERM system TPR-repeat lipoprotein